jgi:hypothetical protein
VSDADVLEAGFRDFIASDEPADVELNWSLGQSLLASQLVAANVGADPITSSEFHDALLLLDTNVLLVVALEASGHASHIGPLAAVLKKIGARVGVLDATREEYARVIEGRRGAILKAAENYSSRVLEESGDNFLQTAVQRQCTSRQDFELFLSELADVPTMFGGDYPIEVIHDSTISAVVADSARDESLQNRIRTVWEEHRSRPKPPMAVLHDAAVTRVVESFRAKGIKSAVLTLDRTMATVAAERAGPKATPSWLILDGLIQILAVDSAGPSLNVAEIAPLMASLIRQQVEPSMNTYTADDLAFMLDVEERCAELPPERVRDIAAAVAHARFQGTERTNPELQLTIRRAFQSGKMQLSRDLEAARSTISASNALARGHEQQIARQRHELGITSDALVDVRTRELRRSAHVRGTTMLLLGLIGTGVAAFIGGWLAVNLLGDGGLRDFVQLLLQLLAPAFGLFTWTFLKVIPKWRGDLKDARSRAIAEAQTLRLQDDSFDSL